MTYSFRNIVNEKQMDDLSSLGFDASRHHAFLMNILDEGFNIHSILIERHGQIAVELYRRGRDKSVYSFLPHTTDFGPAVLHDTRSIGKSVISLLFGIAKQHRDNLHLANPVIDFYPEYSDLTSSKLKSVTLEHLLTMSSGFKWNEGNHFPNDEHRLYWKQSPCRYVLSRPIIAPPGDKFNYNSGGTAILADVLTRVTKTSLKDFARKTLFEPLGIINWEWIADLHGRPMAFTGLRMSPPDMAKIGRLVLNRGEWQGRQIIASDWVINSLQSRINTEFNELQYGYHWWAGHVNWQGKSLAWAAAFGNGGQRVFIVPDLDMSMVITAGAYDNPQVAPRIHRFFKDIISTISS